MVNVTNGETFSCYNSALMLIGNLRIPAFASCCLMAASVSIYSVSQVFFLDEKVMAGAIELFATVALVVCDM